MTRRSQVQFLAGAAGEMSSPGSTFCADLFQYLFHCHIITEDLGHSAKNAGGRLWLNIHAPDMVLNKVAM